jgi:Putative phospholipid-binding domain.
VYAVDAAIRAAGLSIQRLTVAGGEGIVVLTGVAKTVAGKRRAGEVAAGVPGVTEVMNSIVVRR